MPTNQMPKLAPGYYWWPGSGEEGMWPTSIGTTPYNGPFTPEQIAFANAIHGQFINALRGGGSPASGPGIGSGTQPWILQAFGASPEEAAYYNSEQYRQLHQGESAGQSAIKAAQARVAAEESVAIIEDFYNKYALKPNF